jgi:hypothetical protein
MTSFFASRAARTLSQLIERLQAEPAQRCKVGEAARKTILEWDWNRSAAALWELLKNARKQSPDAVRKPSPPRAYFLLWPQQLSAWTRV